jgi:hypothetical protein
MCGVTFSPEGNINFQISDPDGKVLEFPVGRVCGKPAVDFIEFVGCGRTWLCAEHFDEWKVCAKTAEDVLTKISETLK